MTGGVVGPLDPEADTRLPGPEADPSVETATEAESILVFYLFTRPCIYIAILTEFFMNQNHYQLTNALPRMLIFDADIDNFCEKFDLWISLSLDKHINEWYPRGLHSLHIDLPDF